MENAANTTPKNNEAVLFEKVIDALRDVDKALRDEGQLSGNLEVLPIAIRQLQRLYQRGQLS